jgi:hypothetical protein
MDIEEEAVAVSVSVSEIEGEEEEEETPAFEADDAVTLLRAHSRSRSLGSGSNTGAAQCGWSSLQLPYYVGECGGLGESGSSMGSSVGDETDETTDETDTLPHTHHHLADDVQCTSADKRAAAGGRLPLLKARSRIRFSSPQPR